MKRLEFKSAEEELLFLKKVLNAIPCIINVNQVDDLDEPTGNFNLWANQRLYDYTGFSSEEIDKMGFDFFKKTMHPEDIQLITESMQKFEDDGNSVHGGIMRLRPKDGDFHWFIGNMGVMEMKNGKPWRVIVAVQNLEEMNDTRTQILQLIRENLRLKNKLLINSLSVREKQLVRLIAKSYTDKEIALELNISPATVKTHRHNIIQKLSLKNKVGIAQFATENGLD
jgi:PAS domain S-box-containing protein